MFSLDTIGWDTRQGSLTLPKFTADQSVSLNDALKDLGIQQAFDAQNADFSGMFADQPAYIPQVIHKVKITVDEAGTVASAVTAIAMCGGVAPSEPEDPFDMVVNRPCAFAIVYNPNHAVLFAGAINNIEGPR